MALDIHGLFNCFACLFDNLRNGACLSEIDRSSSMTLFMLSLTSLQIRPLKSASSKSLVNKTLSK